MHLVLHIDEILRIIFFKLSDAENYNLALTCKSFLELALDELWNEIQDPDLLLKLLPEEARKSPAMESTDWRENAVNLAQSLPWNKWERFDYYAKRVRRVHLSDYHHLSPESEAYIQTSMIERSTPLLPNLSWITLAGDCSFSGIIPFFILPSIREVHASSFLAPDEFWGDDALVQAIAKIVTSLSSLTLPGLDSTNDFTQVLGGAGRLEEIRLWGEVDWGTIKLLGSLPMLRKMLISVCKTDDAEQDMGTICPWFPSLKIIWGRANVLIPVFLRMERHPITYAYLILHPSGTDIVAAQRFIDLLGSSITPPFGIRIKQSYNEELCPLSLNFMSLQRCGRLRQFHLNSVNSQEPTTEVLLLLAAAWPKLSDLRIKGQRGVSLVVLKAFSDHCPRLREIMVDLEENQQLEEGFEFSKLRRLYRLDLGDRHRGPEHATFVGKIRRQLHGSKAFRRGVL